MSLKKAAEELLKIADDIEAQAEEVTNFVCANCNHTATLATINVRRKEAAEGEGEDVIVSNVTVNDNVSCPACGGEMSYQPNEASEQYYVDPQARQAEDDEEGEDGEDGEKDKSASGPIDYDSLKKYSS
jgi:hypothetical protein